MKLQAPPGNASPRSFRGRVVFRHTRGGNVVVSTWPKPRGKRLTPIQQHQVKTWDTVMKAIKMADHIDVEQATEDTKGTAYYVRDVLTQCAFGAYVSWPGFGPYPDGGATGPAPMPRSGRAARAKAQLANPQKVNVVVKTEFGVGGGQNAVTFHTFLPASAPILLVWDSDPVRIEVKVKRKNKKVDHGKKPWFPQDPVITMPHAGSGKTWSYEMPSLGGYGQPVKHYCLAQLGTDSKSKVSWSTTARKPEPGAVVIVQIDVPDQQSNVQWPFVNTEFDNAIPGSIINPADYMTFDGGQVVFDGFQHGFYPVRIYAVDPSGEEFWVRRQTYLLNCITNFPKLQPATYLDASGVSHPLPSGNFSLTVNPNAGRGFQVGGPVPTVLTVTTFPPATKFTVQPDWTITGSSRPLSTQVQDTVTPPSGAKLTNWLVSAKGLHSRTDQDYP